MRYQQLGDSGLTVSVVGLGGNNFARRIGLDETRAVVDTALDVGITLIDTADTYGDSELMLGEVLAGRRDEVVIATKFGHDLKGRVGTDWGVRGSRRYLYKAVEESLRRLRTDYIDLYQMHDPDPRTPIEETLAALDDLVHQGKVRYIGSSNFAGWQVVEAEWTARSGGLTRFISTQAEYSLLHREVEREVLPACARYRVGFLPFFPLANGLLTGKYRRGAEPPPGSRLTRPGKRELLTETTLARVEVLEKFALDRGRTLLDLAVGWLASRPQVGSVIAGAMTPEQVRANAAAGDWILSVEDLAELDAVAGPREGAAR